MYLAMIISLLVVAILMAYMLAAKKDISNWLIALEVGAFLVFEVLFIIFHPIVGAVSFCGFGLFIIFILTDKYDFTATWWRYVVYGTLAITVLVFVFQLIEVFAGRLF